jgi:hypothetical protein
MQAGAPFALHKLIPEHYQVEVAEYHWPDCSREQ